MIFEIAPSFAKITTAVKECIRDFQEKGSVLAAGRRNTIKIFEIDGAEFNIKSFKIPNLINKIAYRYFRKSKARRSYEYATKLIELGIGTPEPVAFAENLSFTGLRDSYYVSRQMHPKLTYRELVEIPDFPDRENILRQFTRFSWKLHQLGVEFKDHSPGNTLIVEDSPGQYSFYLVDLNRMAFHDNMPFDLRMKNLSRLTPLEDMVAVMSNEYAKLSGEPEEQVFSTMWKYTSDFQYRFHRKRRLKKKLLFRS